MRDFLSFVSTQPPEDRRTNHARGMPDSGNDKLLIMHSIHRQEKCLTLLDREATGSLPFLIDAPQKMAIVASIISEYCKKLDPELFNKRGVPLTPVSLQNLANLAWQAHAIRDRTLQSVGCPPLLERASTSKIMLT